MYIYTWIHTGNILFECYQCSSNKILGVKLPSGVNGREVHRSETTPALGQNLKMKNCYFDKLTSYGSVKRESIQMNFSIQSFKVKKFVCKKFW